MTLLTVILSSTNEIQQDFQAINETINTGMKTITIMVGVILSLIAWIWKSNYSKQEKTEDKVDVLAGEVIKLVALMGELLPQTKDNSTKINDIQVNCAKNNHKKNK